MPNTPITHREKMQRLLNLPGNKYAIYQVKDYDPGNMKFNDLDMMKEKHIDPTMDQYEPVFVANIHEKINMKDRESVQGFCERLYIKFNNQNMFRDIYGHSISISDVVAIKYDEKTTYWFCDSVGFIQIPFVEEAATV